MNIGILAHVCYSHSASKQFCSLVSGFDYHRIPATSMAPDLFSATDSFKHEQTQGVRTPIGVSKCFFLIFYISNKHESVNIHVTIKCIYISMFYANSDVNVLVVIPRLRCFQILFIVN